MNKRCKRTQITEQFKKQKVSSSSPPERPPLNLEVRDEINARYRLIHVPLLKINDYKRYYGVGGYWDLENAGIPSGCSAINLIERINEALRKVHPKLYLAEMTAFGDFRNIKQDDHDILATQFKISKIIPREVFCQKCSPTGTIKRNTDMADACLIQGMLIRAYDLQPPGNMLVITNDQDFATSISALKKRGFTMFLAHGKPTNERLLESSTVNYLWSKMARGEPPGAD